MRSRESVSRCKSQEFRTVERALEYQRLNRCTNSVRMSASGRYVKLYIATPVYRSELRTVRSWCGTTFWRRCWDSRGVCPSKPLHSFAAHCSRTVSPPAGIRAICTPSDVAYRFDAGCRPIDTIERGRRNYGQIHHPQSPQKVVMRRLESAYTGPNCT